jgi:hypothetical protein
MCARVWYSNRCQIEECLSATEESKNYFLLEVTGTPGHESPDFSVLLLTILDTHDVLKKNSYRLPHDLWSRLALHMSQKMTGTNIQRLLSPSNIKIPTESIIWRFCGVWAIYKTKFDTVQPCAFASIPEMRCLFKSRRK